MTKNIFCYLLVLLCLLGCGRHKGEIIPQRKLVPLLVDMHLANALNSGSMQNAMEAIDTSITEYYNTVLKKYNVTRADFDSTMAYYSKKPKQFDKIYEKVISKLSDQEGSFDQPMAFGLGQLENLWNQKPDWILPQDGKESRIEFNIPLHKLGTYTLSAEIKLCSDDASEKPSMVAFYSYNNGTKLGYRDYFPPMPLTKNNRLTVHSITKELKDKKITCIRGYLINHVSLKGNGSKHAEVHSIKLVYTPAKKK